MGITFEEAKKIHAPVIETMSKIGYGLLKDADTFYQYGMELEPRSGITITMTQAYVFHKVLQDQKDRMKQVILNRTGIPAGARNPMRDAIVILGEELIQLIEDEV